MQLNQYGILHKEIKKLIRPLKIVKVKPVFDPRFDRILSVELICKTSKIIFREGFNSKTILQQINEQVKAVHGRTSA